MAVSDGSSQVEKPRRLEDQSALDLPALLELGKKHSVRYLNMATNAPGTFNHVLNQINDGAMLLVGTEETCLIGREHTKRKMPI